MKLSGSSPISNWKTAGTQKPQKMWHEIAIVYFGKHIKRIASPVKRLHRRTAQPVKVLCRRVKLQLAALRLPGSRCKPSAKQAVIHPDNAAQAAIEVSMALQQVRLARNTTEEPPLSALAERYARIAAADMKEWALMTNTHRHQEATIMHQTLRRLASRILTSEGKPDPDDIASFTALLQARATLINSMRFNSQEEERNYAEYGPSHRRYVKRAEEVASLLAQQASPSLPSIPLTVGTRQILAAQDVPAQPSIFLAPNSACTNAPVPERLPLTPWLAKVANREESDLVPPPLPPRSPTAQTA